LMILIFVFVLIIDVSIFEIYFSVLL